MPGQNYNNVPLARFLAKLAPRLKANGTSRQAFERFRPDPTVRPTLAPETTLLTRHVVDRVEAMLTPQMTLLAETGDSWFNGVKSKLPTGAGFEIQMQYGSIGWSVGATLGYAMATSGQRRVVSLIGDGSFQLTAQELSTLIRYELDPIIFLINNRGYTIEVEIHDGPYNKIKNWDYAGLMQVFNAEDGQAGPRASAPSANSTPP